MNDVQEQINDTKESGGLKEETKSEKSQKNTLSKKKIFIQNLNLNDIII